MDPKAVSAISQQVYRQFPELNGVRPRVRKQPAAAGRSSAELTYLLTYEAKVALSGGKTMQRLVRVVADERGTVLKITTSR